MTPLEIFVRSMRWTIIVIFLVFLLGLVLIVYTPGWWGVNLLSVASGSMEPTIPVGSIVIEKPVDVFSILPGDIITYKSREFSNNVITHRVVEITTLDGGRAFRTKGDANKSNDLELVPASKVTGRILFHLPYLGYLSKFIRTRQGWLLIVIIPGIVFILIEVVKILKLIWSSEEEPDDDKHLVINPPGIGLSGKGKRKGSQLP